MNHITIALITGALILIGTIGAVLPAIPGLGVALAGLIFYAWFGGVLSWWGVIVFTILTGLTMIVDLFAPAIAAKGKKASKQGLIGAVIGGLLGMFVLGPIGILLGPFVGAFIGEMIHASNANQAVRVAFSAMFGLVIGTGFKIIIGVSMFIYFLISLRHYL